MLKHYCKIFLQQTSSHKLFTLINVMGLAAGLACCFLIALYVRHELSYDRYHANAENIYRVTVQYHISDGSVENSSAVFGPLAALLKQDFPQIKETARVAARTARVRYDDIAFIENGLRLVDSSFFSLFDFQWLQGNPSRALVEASDIVLTESMARKYFGDHDPTGQTLLVGNETTLRVSGVIADLPTNTHLSGTAFAEMDVLDELDPTINARNEGWFNAAFYTYIQLNPDADIKALNDQLPGFNERHLPSFTDTTLSVVLDRLTDIHMEPRSGDLRSAGDWNVLVIFSAIGLSILVIACINSVNLSTARFTQRAVEVGIKKSLGVPRIQLIQQFLLESLMLTLIAMVLAVMLAELIAPLLRGYLDLPVEYAMFEEPWLVSVLGMLALGTALLSAWYPATVLSSFHPAVALKHRSRLVAGSMPLRNILVVVQFAISIILITAAAVIFSQMQYVNDIAAGFNRDQVLVIRTGNYGSRASLQPLKTQLLTHPGIANVSNSYSTPLRDTLRFITTVYTQTDSVQKRIGYLSVDFDYFDTFDISLLAGRAFAEDIASDRLMLPEQAGGIATGSFVINERAARELGWAPEEALDQLINRNGDWFPVIGVVGNTIESARSEVSPIIYAVPADMNTGAYLSVRLQGNDIADAVRFIDDTWKTLNPDEPVSRAFLDESVDRLYRQERLQMRLCFYFAAVAIVLACMGLFSLAAFNAERRTKEIGVRKVMGGSVWSIVLLLTNDFSRLVLLSNLIAWPVAYVAMNRWLENFAYRIDLTPLVFIGSGLIALCIAWVTVGSTAAKAASAKPVLALRYE